MFYRSTVGALAVAICLGAAGCSTKMLRLPAVGDASQLVPSGVGATSATTR